MQKPLIPALLLLLSLLTVGCDKSNDNNPDNAPVWKVVYFSDQVDKGDDTALFTGYTFALNADNTMTIYLPDGSTKQAKWQTQSNDTRMFITMADPFAPVDGLMGEWLLDEYTDTSIKMKLPPVATTPPPAAQGQEVHLQKQ